MSLATRLKQRREELGMTQTQLAKILGITKGAVGNYETQVSSPKAEILRKLFTVLQCDANYLFQDDFPVSEDTATSESEIKLNREEEQHLNQYRQLDRHGREVVSFLLEKEWQRAKRAKEEQKLIRLDFYELPVSAGFGESLSGEYKTFLELPAEKVPSGTDFVLRVSGDSMNPTLENGDIVFISSTPSVELGEIGVFVLNGEGFVKELGKNRLVSHNSRYPFIPLTEGDSLYCMGRVLGRLSRKAQKARAELSKTDSSRRTLLQAVAREGREETALEIAPFSPDIILGLQEDDDF